MTAAGRESTVVVLRPRSGWRDNRPGQRRAQIEIDGGSVEIDLPAAKRISKSQSMTMISTQNLAESLPETRSGASAAC